LLAHDDARTAMKRSEIIYGVHAVRAMLERHADRILNVRLAQQRDDSRAHELLELAQLRGRPVQRVAMGTLRHELGDVAHQGVAAEITPLLDGVQDPHNLGACLRTADACGALAVIVPRDRAAQLTPAVRKVAAGAAETTPVVAVTNLVRTLKLLKEAGLWIVGADAAATAPARAVDLRGPLVLVLGAEGTGLRHLTRQNCDFLVSLPQRGAVESLNVSVAAAMLLYEALRQRESS